MNKYIISGIIALTASVAIAATEAKSPTKKDDKLICQKTDDFKQLLYSKGFFNLLDMTNENKVNETIWISGTSAIITAESSNVTCIIAVMDNVIYNPDTLQGLVKAYEYQQKKQKDI